MTFHEAIEQVENARYGSEVREALLAALKHIENSMNVDRPTNCPNCGAVINGKSANCEYCGTLLIWKS